MGVIWGSYEDHIESYGGLMVSYGDHIRGIWGLYGSHVGFAAAARYLHLGLHLIILDLHTTAAFHSPLGLLLWQLSPGGGMARNGGLVW